MSKNKRLINSLGAISKRNYANQLMDASDMVVPFVYAGIALALHREYGWDVSEITQLFGQSQDIWSEYGGKDMIKLCEEEVGLKLTSKENN